MTDKAISPLRRRLIEDMAIRRLSPKTQLHYVPSPRTFPRFPPKNEVRSGLAGGGNRIRTIGSAWEGPDASCVGSHSLRLFGWRGTNQRRH
jgi:hypothetical protein